MFMRDFKTNALVATPSYALYLSELAKELEYPMSDYNLKLGLLGSEGCTPEMRGQIEKNWGHVCHRQLQVFPKRGVRACQANAGRETACI